MDRSAHLFSQLTESAISVHNEEVGAMAIVARGFQFLSNLALDESGDNPLAHPAFTLADLIGCLRDVFREGGGYWGYIMNGAFTKLCLSRGGGLQPFVSQQGAIGLAPPSTQPGDEIWLIPTCKSPIILRLHDGKYFVLGRACLGKNDPWEILGQMPEHLTEGEEIAGYKVEAICLQ
jgi:hypothetical protein